MMFRSLRRILRARRIGEVLVPWRRFALCFPLLIVPVDAQGVVSPRDWEARVGNEPNFISPFWNSATKTHQQIHTDLPRAARKISQIAFRQGPKTFEWFNITKTLPRSVQAELWIGDSSFRNRSQWFANNFLRRPTNVIARKRIDIPSFVHPPAGGYPAPFAFVLKFDAPWAYSGKHDLCWEIRVHSNSLSPGGLGNPTALDEVVIRDYAEDRGLLIGKSCLAVGRTQPMTLRGSVRSYQAAAKHTFAWQVENAPAHARSTFLLGLSNPGSFHSQLCTFQYVGSVFAGLNVFANAHGRFASPLLEVPYDSAIAGAKLYVQAYSLDNGRHPGLIPVSATHGLAHAVPSAPPKHVDLAWIAGGLKEPRGGVRDGKGMIIELR